MPPKTAPSGNGKAKRKIGFTKQNPGSSFPPSSYIEGGFNDPVRKLMQNLTGGGRTGPARGYQYAGYSR